MAQVETKKWYESKIVWFAAALFAVSGGNLLFGFLSTRITPEQLQAIQSAYPQAAEIITRLKGGESLLSLLGVILSVFIGIARVWFTPTLIPQSIKKTTAR